MLEKYQLVKILLRSSPAKIQKPGFKSKLPLKKKFMLKDEDHTKNLFKNLEIPAKKPPLYS